MKINKENLIGFNRWHKQNTFCDSENILLGALILDSNLFEKVCQRLTPKDFVNIFHKEIFNAMHFAYKKRRYFDASCLCELLEAKGAYQEYIYSLADDCCSTKNIMSHADIIAEKSVQRQLSDIIFKPIKEN